MTTDWRLYEMLTREGWRPGDEPPIRNKITVEFEGHEIVLPLPEGAKVMGTDEERREAARDGAYKQMCRLEKENRELRAKLQPRGSAPIGVRPNRDREILDLQKWPGM